MGADFTGGSTGKWQGSIKPGYQTATKVAGLPEPDAGYVWRRSKYTVDRYRWAKGLVSFDSDAGDTVTGDTLSITNGAWSGAPLSGSLTFLVIANDLIPSPPGTDMWKETHVSEGYSDWEQWEINP